MIIKLTVHYTQYRDRGIILSYAKIVDYTKYYNINNIQYKYKIFMHYKETSLFFLLRQAIILPCRFTEIVSR